MKYPFFAMLYNQSQTRLIPLKDEDGDVALYATREKAAKEAEDTFFGHNFGFEVFEAGNGVDWD